MTGRAVAILSPGYMDSGLGTLLREKSFIVVTNLYVARRELMGSRKWLGFGDLGSDHALHTAADIVISVLVPSSSTATERRIAAYSKEVDRGRPRTKSYINANAVVPSTVRQMHKLFADSSLIDRSLVEHHI